MPKKPTDLSLVHLFDILRKPPVPMLNSLNITYHLYQNTDTRKHSANSGDIVETEKGAVWRIWLAEAISNDKLQAEMAKPAYDAKMARIEPPKGRGVWCADETDSDLRECARKVFARLGWDKLCCTLPAWAELAAALAYEPAAHAAPKGKAAAQK